MSEPRWLLLAHQLPPRPSRLRVKTWRRLQQVGAIQVRPALYALPDTPACREDFEWLRREVVGMGGEASVFAADPLGGEAGEIQAVFQRAREEEYRGLTGDIDRLRRTLARRSRRRPAGVARAVGALRDRWRDLARIDFFHAPGRAQAARALAALERAVPSPRASRPLPRRRWRTRYRGRRWVTRPRPGVDRMASAWLIRRFVDPDATFVFAAQAGPAEVAFDMYAGEFSHHGGACTFEVLADRFGLRHGAVARIAEIVHDLDMNDARFGSVEAPAIGRLVDGLRATHADDALLLEQGIAMFDALARSFERDT